MTFAEIIPIVDGLFHEAQMWDARREPTTAAAERALARRILARAS